MIVQNPQALGKLKEMDKTKPQNEMLQGKKYSEDKMWAKSALARMTEEELENPLLFNEKEEKVEIQNIEQIEEDETELIGLALIEAYSGQEEAKEIKVSKQFHLPSYHATLLKETLVNSLELTEKKREELKKDSKADLDEIVHRYVSDEEKNRIAKEIKAHLTQFWKLRTALADDPVLNTEEKARMLYNFSKPFAADVAVFHSMYENGSLTKKREEHLEEYIKGLEGLYEYFDKYDKGKKADGVLLTLLGLRTGSAHQRMFEADVNVLKNAGKRAKNIDEYAGKKEMLAGLVYKEESEQRNIRADMDSSLSAEQKKGVNRMDSWLIERGLKSTKRLPFINTVMTLSARERLFIYYLIEHDHLATPSMQDITVSQTSYVPDVTAIRWKMYRVPYRLWEKAGHEGLVKHHWEKLEAAMQIVKQEDVVSAIQGYADAFKTEKTIKEKLDKKDPEYQYYKRVKELTTERDSMLDALILKLSECEEAYKKAESAWIYKSRKRALAKEKLIAAQAAINDLEVVNKHLEQKLSEKDLIDSRKLKDKLGENKDKKEIKSDYREGNDTKEYGMYVSGQALALLSKSGSITSLMTPAITAALKSAQDIGDAGKIDAIGKGLDAANYATGAIITLKGVHALFGAFSSIKKTKDAIESGDISKADSLLMAAQSTYGLTTGIANTLIGLKNMQFAQKSTDVIMGAKDVKDAVDSMKAGVKKTNVALAMSGLALNAADAAMQGVHLIHHIKSDIKVSDLNLQGNEETYMQGLSNLELNNKTRKIVGTAFSTVSNMGTLASQFLGPAGSLAWGGISLGLSMTSKLTDYLMKDAAMTKTAEDFFNLIDISDLVVDDQVGDEIKEAYKKRALRDLSESKEAQKELKDSLLLHMAAKLGFTSFKSLFKHIVSKYAEFLHFNLFYYDGDKMVLEGDEKRHKMSQACAEMVKSMGLNVVFPTSKDEETAKKQRHPSKKMIESKLGA